MSLSDIARRDAENRRTASGRSNESEQDANRGGLTRTVGAEEPEHLAGRNGQTQVVDGDDAPETVWSGRRYGLQSGNRCGYAPQIERARGTFPESGH